MPSDRLTRTAPRQTERYDPRRDGRSDKKRREEQAGQLRTKWHPLPRPRVVPPSKPPPKKPSTDNNTADACAVALDIAPTDAIDLDGDPLIIRAEMEQYATLNPTMQQLSEFSWAQLKAICHWRSINIPRGNTEQLREHIYQHIYPCDVLPAIVLPPTGPAVQPAVQAVDVALDVDVQAGVQAVLGQVAATVTSVGLNAAVMTMPFHDRTSDRRLQDDGANLLATGDALESSARVLSQLAKQVRRKAKAASEIKIRRAVNKQRRADGDKRLNKRQMKQRLLFDRKQKQLKQARRLLEDTAPPRPNEDKALQKRRAAATKLLTDARRAVPRVPRDRADAKPFVAPDDEPVPLRRGLCHFVPGRDADISRPPPARSSTGERAPRPTHRSVASRHNTTGKWRGCATTRWTGDDAQQVRLMRWVDADHPVAVAAGAEGPYGDSIQVVVLRQFSVLQSLYASRRRGAVKAGPSPPIADTTEPEPVLNFIEIFIEGAELIRDFEDWWCDILITDGFVTTIVAVDEAADDEAKNSQEAIVVLLCNVENLLDRAPDEFIVNETQLQVLHLPADDEGAAVDPYSDDPDDRDYSASRASKAQAGSSDEMLDVSGAENSGDSSSSSGYDSDSELSDGDGTAENGDSGDAGAESQVGGSMSHTRKLDDMSMLSNSQLRERAAQITAMLAERAERAERAARAARAEHDNAGDAGDECEMEEVHADA